MTSKPDTAKNTESPYHPPTVLAAEPTPQRDWRKVYSAIAVHAWWTGAALVASVWARLQPELILKIGFALLSFAAVGPWLFANRHTTHATDPEHQVFPLDSRLLRAGNDYFHRILDRFLEGSAIYYDGVSFMLIAPKTVVAAIHADNIGLDESSALELTRHSEFVFQRLCRDCSEFANAVEGRSLTISIVTSPEESHRELYRMTGGELTNMNP